MIVLDIVDDLSLERERGVVPTPNVFVDLKVTMLELGLSRLSDSWKEGASGHALESVSQLG